MIRRLAVIAALATALMVNPPRQDRTCPHCGQATDADRQTCPQCLIPDPPRPTGNEGMGRSS